jgi:hypothetical protein
MNITKEQIDAIIYRNIKSIIGTEFHDCPPTESAIDSAAMEIIALLPKNKPETKPAWDCLTAYDIDIGHQTTTVITSANPTEFKVILKAWPQYHYNIEDYCTELGYYAVAGNTSGERLKA